jgi:hypothetical protein
VVGYRKECNAQLSSLEYRLSDNHTHEPSLLPLTLGAQRPSYRATCVPGTNLNRVIVQFVHYGDIAVHSFKALVVNTSGIMRIIVPLEVYVCKLFLYSIYAHVERNILHSESCFLARQFHFQPQVKHSIAQALLKSSGLFPHFTDFDNNCTCVFIDAEIVSSMLQFFSIQQMAER